MSTVDEHVRGPARAGDWLEAHGRPGMPPRRGQVLEVLGQTGHEHYRVRWDEQHESVFFPTEGVRIIRHEARGRGGADRR